MKRLFHIVWICLAVAACSKDELPGTHGEFASLTLSVASSQNDVKTRAVSADADEQRINNLYIFIFNPDGSVDCRNYISSLSASSWTGTISGLTCGTGKSVAAIANTDNTVVDITREMLDGIASRAALDSCVVNLRGKFIERLREIQCQPPMPVLLSQSLHAKHNAGAPSVAWSHSVIRS